jgi:membrane-associated phospholipid phosphatase
MPPLYAHDPFVAVQRAVAMRWLDVPMALLSIACEGWMVALIALAMYAWLEKDVPSVWKTFAPLVVGLVAGGVLVHVLKDVWATPRPLAVYGPARVHVLLQPLWKHGFPSGHSVSAGTFAAFTLAVYGRRGLAAIALPLLGGVSRVYVGAHWVADVIGGWAIGIGLALLVYFAAVRVLPRGHLARLRAERAQARLDMSSKVP